MLNLRLIQREFVCFFLLDEMLELKPNRHIPDNDRRDICHSGCGSRLISRERSLSYRIWIDLNTNRKREPVLLELRDEFTQERRGHLFFTYRQALYDKQEPTIKSSFVKLHVREHQRSGLAKRCDGMRKPIYRALL